MSICTAEATKALESQTGVPINWNKISTSSTKDWKTDTSCSACGVPSPHPELNEDLPEHLDELAILHGRHFGG